jgi:hypothetical protein
MKSKNYWCPMVISCIAAGPAGGFLFGLLHAGDPDPNPIGRVVYACIMAFRTPLHAGFPFHDEGGQLRSYNAWPHIVVAFLLIFAAGTYREWRKQKDAV